VFGVLRGNLLLALGGTVCSLVCDASVAWRRLCSKDDHGTAIVCVDETLDLETCKGIVQVRYVLH
jgi:hypothetical protein